MVGYETVNSVFTRKEARAALCRDTVKRSIYAKRIRGDEMRGSNLDAPDPVAGDYRADRLSADSYDNHSLFHAFGPELLGIADDFAGFLQRSDSDTDFQVTNAVVSQYGLP